MKQSTIPGTEPVELYPDVRTKLHAWLAAVEAAAEARGAVKRSHDTLLDAIQDAKIPYYTYSADGKKKRVYPTAEPKLKTSTVQSEAPPGRRGRRKDVALPIDQERERAAVALLGEEVTADDRVEHRKVPRATVVDESDPFAATRALLEQV